MALATGLLRCLNCSFVITFSPSSFPHGYAEFRFFLLPPRVSDHFQTANSQIAVRKQRLSSYSIHPFSKAASCCSQGEKREIHPNCLGAKTPWTIRQLIAEPHRLANKHTLISTPTVYLDFPLHLPCMMHRQTQGEHPCCIQKDPRPRIEPVAFSL